jgi:DHA2 family multidrug resistance protein
MSGVVTGRLSDYMSPAIVALVALAALTGVFYLFSTVSALTTAGVLVGYIILYRICMFSIVTSMTALNVQVLPMDQVRMGQGLLGVVRNIGGSLGVTITSVLFEHQRVRHELSAYHGYDAASLAHFATINNVKAYLHAAGITGGAADEAALRTIRQQIEVEAIAAAFRDSFLMISIAFVLAAMPLGWIIIRRLHTRA